MENTELWSTSLMAAIHFDTLYIARGEIGVSASFTMVLSPYACHILVQNGSSEPLLCDLKEIHQNETFTV